MTQNTVAEVQKKWEMCGDFSKDFNASPQDGNVTDIPKPTTKLMNKVSYSFMLSSWKSELWASATWKTVFQLWPMFSVL